ncbi:phosphatase PAP2 family protein [Ensifer sp. LCM 4579]|uniref:phosphatase PAP2 family protein n=1 Tax=Ensifer sp. LCM 4579 TaxID=1848292 RepID=UPI0008D93B3F|nr:phosphatase PAP2 family protein [Ensifer sp. LCM 4579]OHV75361.1 hypothetical protein LCM4579_07475 [Ensifer sp. LCM 4579]
MSTQPYSPDRNAPTWFLVCAACSAVIAFVIQLHALQELVDLPVAEFFRAQRGTTLQQIASFLTQFGKAQFMLVPSLVVFLAFRFRWRRPAWALRAWFVFVSVAAAGIFVDVLKVVFGRTRPKMFFSDGVHHFSYFRFGADYYSFPSGHAVCAMAFAVALAIVMPRYRAISILAGLALASTRVIVTAHYVSDVVASAVIAVVTVLAIRAIVLRPEERASIGLFPDGERAGTVGEGATSKTAKGTRGRTAMTDPITEMIAITVAIASAGLAFSLCIAEWYAPAFQPVPEWWLWSSLFLCCIFGAPLHVTNRPDFAFGWSRR